MTRKLKMRGEMKFKIIKSVVRKEINKKSAAEILRCSMRNINLLIKKYLEHGRIAFIHKNSGRIPAKAFSRGFENKIIELYKTKYFDFNYAHRDKLREDKGIVTSYSYLRTLLLKNNIYSLRLHKKTQKELKKKFALL